MTTIVISSPEGADSHESGALDPFAALWHILPKLAEPGWYKDVHSGVYVPARTEVAEEKAAAANPAVQKAKRRERRKKSRLARALAGEHTRVSAHASA